MEHELEILRRIQALLGNPSLDQLYDLIAEKVRRADMLDPDKQKTFYATVRVEAGTRVDRVGVYVTAPDIGMAFEAATERCRKSYRGCVEAIAVQEMNGEYKVE